MAVNNRVKKMANLSGDGMGLMGNAFKDDDQPTLVLADLATQTGKYIQAGCRFLPMGSQQAIRNPHAHEQFGEMDDDEAFELLGIASHLMRKLALIRAKGHLLCFASLPAMSSAPVASQFVRGRTA